MGFGMRFYSRIFPLVFVVMVATASCNREDYTPKPRGYFRITFPEKEYRLLDTIYPYSFEYPVYGRILNDEHALSEVNWIHVDFPVFRGRLHVSYKEISKKEDLIQYIEDSRTLAFKHIPKSSGIEQIPVEFPQNKVYGLTYSIRGQGAASPYQFYLTDSVHHFIRGALYFNAIPNSDSLRPVIDFVKRDIEHLIETMHWKE